ncbi:LacI family transcriptional regulator [Blautia schinkii]|nr:LacI family transcriptional regulator [Blautia schinkii]
MSTIQEVAKAAGVSPALVSRVINGKEGVSAEARERILEKMKELDYHPNPIARSLVTKRTNVIGVILDNLCDPFLTELIHGIEDEINLFDYDIFFCDSRDNLISKKRSINFLSQGRVDGFIVYGSNLEEKAFAESMLASTCPVVAVEHTLEKYNINNVTVDNFFGSRIAVNYLIRCGCRKICHVTGNLAVKAAVERRDGYFAAMKEFGLPVLEEDVIEGDFTFDGGYQAVAAYLSRSRGKTLPDAFYFGGGSAYGGMMALEDYGFCSPEDVMIIGYDNSGYNDNYRKFRQATYVQQPLYEMGRQAANILINDIQNHHKKKKHVTLYPKLIVRETTPLKAPKAADDDKVKEIQTELIIPNE